ncbi:hypothetical protein ACSV5M_17225 [Cellvibrio sp. ARAG 10.3]|uniref:hypothetical protein n=1 Tax=Cellvibrio sp. ARAG 10.3 TaxID=3451358 RepID=UPI003F47FC0B
MPASRKLPTLFASLIISLATANTCADVVITPNLGRSKIDLKPAYAIDGEGTRVDGTHTGVSVGYRFDANILIGGNLSFTYGDNLFSAADDYRLYEGKAFIGYVTLSSGEPNPFVAALAFNFDQHAAFWSPYC